MTQVETPRASSRGFWVGFAVGAPLMVIGVRGMLVNAHDTHPAELARWLVGSAVVHDALVLPIAAGVGLVGRRVVPAWAWPPIRWAVATTAILIVVSWPFVARYGVSAANPSALPRNYGLGVAVATTGVWLAATGWALLLKLRRRPR